MALLTPGYFPATFYDAGFFGSNFFGEAGEITTTYIRGSSTISTSLKGKTSTWS